MGTCRKCGDPPHQYRVFRKLTPDSGQTEVFSTPDKAAATEFARVANIAFKARSETTRCHVW